MPTRDIATYLPQIDDRSLIGIGSIVLNGAMIEENAILGVGSQVGEGKRPVAGDRYCRLS